MTVKDVILHEGYNIKSLQLVEDRFMYIMYNKVKNFQFDSRSTAPKARAKLALLQSGNGTGLMELDIVRNNPHARMPLIPVSGALVGCNNHIVLY